MDLNPKLVPNLEQISTVFPKDNPSQTFRKIVTVKQSPRKYKLRLPNPNPLQTPNSLITK